MADQVPDEVKRERIERLVEVVQRVAARAQPRARRPRRGGARRGPVPHRPGAPARADAPQHDGQLHRHRRPPGELVGVAIDGATSTTLRGRAVGRPLPPDAAEVLAALRADRVGQERRRGGARAPDPGGELVSADAMQLYRGLPSPTEPAAAAPDPAGRDPRPGPRRARWPSYQRLAHAAIDEILAGGRMPDRRRRNRPLPARRPGRPRASAAAGTPGSASGWSACYDRARRRAGARAAGRARSGGGRRRPRERPPPRRARARARRGGIEPSSRGRPPLGRATRATRR